MSERLRIGVVGCGAIAQIQHLPNLAFLRDEFELAAVCDVSATLARAAARDYGGSWHTDLDGFLGEDLDAAILCQTDPKVDAALQVLASGRHLFIEKPVAFVPDDVDRMAQAAADAGVVAQAGYMKLFDPAFVRLEAEVDSMRDRLRFVQVNHLHTDNRHHLAHFRLTAADDLPAGSREAAQERRLADAQRALGDVPDDVRAAFFHLSGSMIHDLYGLRQLFGPATVRHAEIWNGGLGISLVLGWDGLGDTGPRCAGTWVELEEIRHFRETLEVYGSDRGVILSYPTGFAVGQPSRLWVRGVQGGEPFESEIDAGRASAFVEELQHFHQCITANETCRTPLSEARHDVQLVVDAALAGA